MSRVIAFWSPSGAGASTLLLNVAACMGARRANLAAVDLNLVTPSLALAADLLPHDRPRSACLSRLLPALDGGWLTAEELNRHLLPGPGFALLPGMLDVVAASNLTDGQARQIVQTLAGRFEYVLADLTPAIDSVACLPLLEQADQVVLVVGPEIASRFHTRRYLEAVKAMGLDGKCLAVLNRAGAIAVDQVVQDLDMQIRATVPDLKQMPGLVEAGQIAGLAQSVSPALAKFRTAVEGLVKLLGAGG